MKFVVVKIVRETRPEKILAGAQYRYPDSYDAMQVHVCVRGPHVYDGGIMMFHGETEELLLCLPDELVDSWVKTDPDGFRALTSAEAETWMANNRRIQAQPSEMVSDAGANKLLLVMARTLTKMAEAQGVEIALDDKNALDPDHAELGVERPKKELAQVFQADLVSAIVEAEIKMDPDAKV